MGLSLRNIGKKITDFVGGTNIQAGQRSIEAANQQLQAQPAKYGVLSAPQVTNQFVQTQARGNTFNPVKTAASIATDMAVGGVKRGGQFVAGTVLSPFSNKVAQQQADYAERVLGKAYAPFQGGQNMAEVEAGRIKQDLMTDPLQRTNVGLADSPWTVGRKATGALAEGALDILTLGAGGTIKAGAKVGLKQLAKTAVKPSILSAASGAANVAQQDVASQEALKQILLSGAFGAALPFGVRGAQVAAPKVLKAAKGGAKVVAKAESAAFTPRDNPRVTGFDDQYKTLQKAYDNTPDVTAKQRISKAMADNRAARNQELQAVTQGGYLQGSDKPKVTAKKPSTIDTDDPFGNRSLIKKIRNEAGSLVDDDAQMITLLRKIEKETGKQGLVDQWYFDTGNIRASNSIANAKLRNSEDFSGALKGLSKRELKEFDDYVGARAELKNYEGLPTSRTPEVNQAVVAAGDAKYGERFTNLNNFYKKQAQDMYDAGLISKDKLDYYKTSDDYVRIQRDMEDLVSPGFGGSKARSLGSTTANQKRTGSSREIVSPTGTVPKRTQQVQLEIQRNKAASNTLDVLEEAGLAKRLVNADDVKARREAFKTLKELKPLRDALGQEVKQTTKQLRELTKRNKELGPTVLKRIQGSAPEVRKNAVTLANNGKKAVNRPDSKRLSKAPNEADIQEAFEQYLDGDPTLVRNMYEFMGNKAEAARVVNKLDGLKAQYDQVKADRSDLFLDARSHADLTTRNKNTIKRMRDGIAEVYEVPGDIKKVMDNVNPYQLGVIARIVSAPTRLARAGLTALSAPFTVTNYLRDQASSAIYSKSVIATHNPKNIIAGLASASRDFAGESRNPLWKKFEEFAGDQTFYDELRNAQNTRRLLKEVRRGQAGKVSNMLTQPIRTLEDLNSITEKATRFQNFKGIYEKTIKAGLGEDEAIKRAVLAARQNSVDFQRSSSFTRAMNLFIPYFNAGVQGSRNVARSFRDRPLATSMKSVGFVATPAVALTAYNLSDAKRREVYDSIDEFEKENNFIIVGPNAKQRADGGWEGIYKIPKPQGYRELTDPVRDVAEAFFKGEKVEDVAGMFKDMVGGLTGPVNIDDGRKFVGSFVPQAAKPWLQAAMNMDLYTGSKTVPDYMADETDDPTKQAYKGTSGTARAIANQLGVSPIKVEKAIADIAGSLGRYGINASDNLLASTGAIPKEQIGGRSIASDFSRRLFEASGETLDKNKTEGAKFFEDRKKALESVGLNKNEQAAFDSIFPNKKDFMGGELTQKTYYDGADKAITFQRYPKVFEAAKETDRLQRERGKPGDPLYDLSPQQRNVVLQVGALGASPGNREAAAILKLNPWLKDYYAQRSGFFDKIKTTQTPEEQAKSGVDPKGMKIPTATGTLKTKLDQLGSITDKAQRSQFYAENPDVLDHFSKQDDYERAKRVFMGLPMFDPYPSAPPEVQSLLSAYSKLPKGEGPNGKSPTRSAWIKSHPNEWAKMTDYFNVKSQYDLAQSGSLAVYENLGFNEDDYKDIQSLARGGGGGGFTPFKKSDPTANKYEYALKPSSGGFNSAKVSFKARSGANVSSKRAKATKPKVSFKKSRV